MSTRQPRILLFGGSGSIGRSVVQRFIEKKWLVTIATRGESEKHQLLGVDYIDWNPARDIDFVPDFDGKLFSAVCWAQGSNINDNIFNIDFAKHLKLYEANVIYILVTLNSLLKNHLLEKNAKLVVISSIWQEISRQNKLSYGITKSAIRGLVLSLANDLAKHGYLINAVLPGALDTPMTKSNLTEQQIQVIANSTGFQRLPQLTDVSTLIYYLLSDENLGVTGQFIKVDLGFSDVRNF